MFGEITAVDLGSEFLKTVIMMNPGLKATKPLKFQP
jgi:hypothetical protein